MKLQIINTHTVTHSRSNFLGVLTKFRTIKPVKMRMVRIKSIIFIMNTFQTKFQKYILQEKAQQDPFLIAHMVYGQWQWCIWFYLNILVFIKQSNLQQSMSEDSAQESSENEMERLAKKLKKDEVKVNIDPEIDITQLAVQKYETIKKNYHFVSFQEANKAKVYKNCKTETHSIPIHDFNEQMYRFRRNGYCADPDTQTKGFVFGNKLKDFKEKSEAQGEVIDQTHPQFLEQLYPRTTSKTKKEITKMYKSTREEKGNDIQSYRGPWAGYGENLYNGALTQQQKQQLAKAEQTKQIKIEQAKVQERNFEPYSVFHWGEYTDYKGLSYVEPPVGYKRGGQNCYLPKNEVFSWVGSQKQGVQVVRFFPKTGHFFLLGTPQGKAHLFDIAKNKTCAHTYYGHAKALRDVQFSHNGKNFLTGGFDKKVLYWDTQYGKAQSTFNLKGIPFTLKFHPSEHHPNIFLVGSSNRKILQFDLRTCAKTMEYNQHLGAINTLTFIEENKFVSSSDDKKIFIWQYGVPVVTRHVSQPQMHSITATAMHPSGEYYAGQSSDNQIIIYENKGGNFRRIRAKKFASHYCAGYACAIDFSYDGQFLVSGDERGKIYCYDWKTTKVFRILDGHAGACIGVEWHPSQPTTMLTCGWEGMVKLWQ